MNEDGMTELVLDPSINKTGDTWHICIEVVSFAETSSSDSLRYLFVFSSLFIVVNFFYITIGFASQKCSLWLPC